MHTLFLEPDKNRIILELSGNISKDEVREISSELKQMIMEVGDGFDLVNDISQFKVGSPEAYPLVKMLALFLQKHKPGRVIRITGQSRIGKAQLERMIDSLEPYTVHYVSDMENALKILDSE